ncbi:MAG TPA: hypothetical protein VLO11_15000 [Luteolibacter sp.]|nr:hypothetical protein [Luteolibacter sp.]
MLATAAGMRAETTGAGGIGPFRTQAIQLEAGWNAVYLEIEPRKTDPSLLFAGTPIEIAAAYNRPVTAMEFIDSPDEALPDRKGWNVWYAPHREDALLGNLSAIQAHQAYLLYAKEAHTWSLEGTPFHGSARWHPHAFSLVGFPIDAAEQPTVASFFAGAGAHSPLKAYRMSGGQWSLITQPEQTLMKPGAAYWIHSDGASDFRGPLTVNFPGSASGGLVFNAATSTRTLELRNTSPNPQYLTLTTQGGNTGLLPLSYVVRVLDAPGQPVDAVSVPLTQGLRLGPLEPGSAFFLNLEVAQEAVTAPVMSTTLTISSTAGPRIEVPLVSLRSDLLENP